MRAAQAELALDIQLYRKAVVVAAQRVQMETVQTALTQLAVVGQAVPVIMVLEVPVALEQRVLLLLLRVVPEPSGRSPLAVRLVLAVAAVAELQRAFTKMAQMAVATEQVAAVQALLVRLLELPEPAHQE